MQRSSSLVAFAFALCAARISAGDAIARVSWRVRAHAPARYAARQKFFFSAESRASPSNRGCNIIKSNNSPMYVRRAVRMHVGARNAGTRVRRRLLAQIQCCRLSGAKQMQTAQLSNLSAKICAAALDHRAARRIAQLLFGQRGIDRHYDLVL